jgi:Beta-carotene 15,15'-dioxygenase
MGELTYSMESLYPFRSRDRGLLAYQCCLVSLLLALGLCVLKRIAQIEVPHAWLIVAAVVVGTPHGASDGFVILREFRSLKARAWVFLGYVGSVLVLLAVGARFPRFATLLLVVMSVWHFGERDRRHLSNFATLALGATILASLFYAGNRQSFLFPAIALCGSFVLGYRALKHRQDAGADLAIAITVMALDTLLSPILAFVVYFTCIHSVEHTASLLRAARAIGKMRALITIAAVLTAVALGLSMLLIGRLSGSALHENARALQWMNVYFAAFTLPHLVLLTSLRMHRGGKAFGAI